MDLRARRDEGVRAGHGLVQANSGEVLRAAAIGGLGLVLLPEWMVARDVTQGRLQACLKEYTAYPPPYREPIYVVHRRGNIPAKSPCSSPTYGA